MRKDDQCNDVEISTNETEPMCFVMVVSFPSSGNIWLRHMLKGVIGNFTDSFKGHSSGSNIIGEYGY